MKSLCKLQERGMNISFLIEFKKIIHRLNPAPVAVVLQNMIECTRNYQWQESAQCDTV